MVKGRNDNYRSVRVPQGEIRYREYGSGEPIVFVHGLLVNGSLWRKVVPLLSPHYRCIVPDWPLGAHEQLMNPDADLSPTGLARIIADFLAALKLQSVTLVGNDTGGALCQITVTEYPERIARLVLTNCDCFDNFPPLVFRPLIWASHIPGSIYLLAQMLRSHTIRQLPTVLGGLTRWPVERKVVEEWVQPVINRSEIRSELAKVLKAISPRYTQTAAQKLKNFTRPVLLAWAPEDPFFHYRHAEQLSKLFPNASLKPIKESRAFIPEDQPEHLATAITDFMVSNRYTLAAS